MAEYRPPGPLDNLTPYEKQKLYNETLAKEMARGPGVITNAIPEIGVLETLWDLARGKVFRYDLYPESMPITEIWDKEAKRLFDTLVWHNDPNKPPIDNLADNLSSWGLAYAYPWGKWGKWLLNKSGLTGLYWKLLNQMYHRAAYDQAVRRYPFVAFNPKNKYGFANVQTYSPTETSEPVSKALKAYTPEIPSSWSNWLTNYGLQPVPKSPYRPRSQTAYRITSDLEKLLYSLVAELGRNPETPGVRAIDTLREIRHPLMTYLRGAAPPVGSHVETAPLYDVIEASFQAVPEVRLYNPKEPLTSQLKLSLKGLPELAGRVVKEFEDFARKTFPSRVPMAEVLKAYREWRDANYPLYKVYLNPGVQMPLTVYDFSGQNPKTAVSRWGSQVHTITDESKLPQSVRVTPAPTEPNAVIQEILDILRKLGVGE